MRTVEIHQVKPYCNGLLFKLQTCQAMEFELFRMAQYPQLTLALKNTFILTKLKSRQMFR